MLSTHRSLYDTLEGQNVDLSGVIRRWHHRDELASRKIARCTGLSRNTTRRYLANVVIEPKYPSRSSPSKLDAYAETLSSWLKRKSRRNRKQRRHLKRLYHDLVFLEDHVITQSRNQ